MLVEYLHAQAHGECVSVGAHCAWLRAGGLSEETLTMLQAFNLDGLRLAKLGSIEQKQDEATKHLQRNLGLSEGESEAIVRQLGELQTAEVVAWLDDKARELDGLYPRITDAVKFCASQRKAEEAKGKADEVDGKATDRAARAQQQAERDGVQRRRRRRATARGLPTRPKETQQPCASSRCGAACW